MFGETWKNSDFNSPDFTFPLGHRSSRSFRSSKRRRSSMSVNSATSNGNQRVQRSTERSETTWPASWHLYRIQNGEEKPVGPYPAGRCNTDWTWIRQSWDKRVSTWRSEGFALWNRSSPASWRLHSLWRSCHLTNSRPGRKNRCSYRRTLGSQSFILSI